MKTNPLCITSCFCKGITLLINRIAPEKTEFITREIEKITAVFDKDLPPPYLAKRIYRKLAELTGITDPFRTVKDKSIDCALQLMDKLTALCENSDAPFETAVRLAIAGNVIDYGAKPDLTLEEARSSILSACSEPLDQDAVRLLRHRMDRAEKILYIMDNCGEAVIDRLLIDRYPGRITIAVRGEPILNDMTLREVAPSGLDHIPAIDTGDGTPGVDPAACSEQFRAAYDSADLIIAKGQGNFETLEGRCTRNTAFLFRAKCQTVARQLNVQPLSMLLIHETPC